MGPDKREDQSGYDLTGQVASAYPEVRLLHDSPTRRRGSMSLLIRRDATLRMSGALHLCIFDQPGKKTFSTSC